MLHQQSPAANNQFVQVRNTLQTRCTKEFTNSSPSRGSAMAFAEYIMRDLQIPKVGSGCWATVWSGHTETVYKLFSSSDGYMEWLNFVLLYTRELTPNAARYLPRIFNVAIVASNVYPTVWPWPGDKPDSHILLVEIERLHEFAGSLELVENRNHIRSARAGLEDTEPSRKQHNKSRRAVFEIMSHPNICPMHDISTHNIMLRREFADGRRAQIVITDPCCMSTSSKSRSKIVPTIQSYAEAA